jgi:hypothetical protein
MYVNTCAHSSDFQERIALATPCRITWELNNLVFANKCEPAKQIPVKVATGATVGGSSEVGHHLNYRIPCVFSSSSAASLPRDKNTFPFVY